MKFMQNQENKKFKDKLLQFRQNIDQIDFEILDLLIKRADIVKDVKELKEQNNDKFFVKSAREADMIRNLIKKAEGKIPDQLILNIWRKIISFSNYFEQKINIALHNPMKNPEFERILRSYYNDYIPITEIDNPATIFKDLEQGKFQIAYFALPKDDEEQYNKWWINLANNQSGIRVFVKIPLFKNGFEYDLVGIAIKDDEQSDHDKSLLVIEQSKEFSYSNLEKLLTETFPDFKILKCCDSDLNKNDRFYLVEIAQFIKNDDEKLKLLNSSKSKPFSRILGVYPALFDAS